MDLTPPSLTNSPYSPQRKSFDSPPPFLQSICMSDSAGSSLGSLSSVNDNCDLTSSMLEIDPSLGQPVSTGSPFAPLDSIPPSVAWATPDITNAPSPATSTTSSMPNVLSSEYEHFNPYEPSCLSAPYSAAVTAYSRPASHSPAAFMHTPPPSSGDVSGRETPAFPSRSSLGYGHEALTARPKLRDTFQYSPETDNLAYGLSRPLAPNSHPVAAHQTRASTHVFFPDSTQGQGSGISLQSPSLPAQAMACHSLSASSPPDTATHWDRTKRTKRRPTRRHTTKEDANFQCTVKGCGKFFSRSYNFKSHMETHDDKREYPFPCQEPDCTKKFVRKTDLQRHHQSVHAKERNHKCDYCARLFARKDTLRRHMEDGCSKRFEVPMVEGSTENLGVSGMKSFKTRDSNVVPSEAALPPTMTVTPANGKERELQSWR